jgi:hypothetical protein
MRTTNRTPSKDSISNHWISFLLQNKKASHKSFIYESACFACGCVTKHLDRAHIKPVISGGSDNLDNLHLLCKICHKESEFLEDDEYWQWFFAMSIQKRKAIEYLKYGVGPDIDKFVKNANSCKHHEIMESSFDKANSRFDKQIRILKSLPTIGRPSTSKQHKESVIEMRKQGMPIKKIAKTFSIGVGTVYSLLSDDMVKKDD